MKISVFGLGYVGLTSTACAINDSHQVTGVDINSERVDALNTGLCPIYEPGLEEILKKGISSGSFQARTTIGPHILTDDLAIICVGTPSMHDGSHNMTYISAVVTEIAKALLNLGKRTSPLVISLRSTVRPGTMRNVVEKIFEKHHGNDYSSIANFVYNPEFLRESTAIDDYYNPPKIVIGTKDGMGCKVIESLYGGISAPIFNTGFAEAEMTKFVDNTFHALKVTFANEIGRIAVGHNVSAKMLHKIFISDTKLNISPYYLRPGGAFGGSCLPKDVRALNYLASEVDSNAHVISSLIKSNEDHKKFLFQNATKGLKDGANVLLNGLAFKDKTDDLRESPLLDIAEMTIKEGFNLKIYDPFVTPMALSGSNLGYSMSHLPNLGELFVSKSEISDKKFDLVIDARGNGATLSPNSKIYDINNLS